MCSSSVEAGSQTVCTGWPRLRRLENRGSIIEVRSANKVNLAALPHRRVFLTFVRNRFDSSTIWTYLANKTLCKLSRKFKITLNEKEFSASLRSQITNIRAYTEESRDVIN